MKAEEKKIVRGFRIRADLNRELVSRSRSTGIPETRIVEDAMDAYFKRAMAARLVASAAEMESVNSGQDDLRADGEALAAAVRRQMRRNQKAV